MLLAKLPIPLKASAFSEGDMPDTQQDLKSRLGLVGRFLECLIVDES